MLFQYLPVGKGDEREVPDFQIKQKNLKKTAIFLHRHKTSSLQQDNHDQEPNALNDIPNDLPSTKTSSNDRQEEEYLEYVAECIEKAMDHQLDLSWSAFNANKTGSPATNPNTTAMMPMFREDSNAMIKNSAAMIKNSMIMI